MVHQPEVSTVHLAKNAHGIETKNEHELSKMNIRAEFRDHRTLENEPEWPLNSQQCRRTPKVGAPELAKMLEVESSTGRLPEKPPSL